MSKTEIFEELPKLTRMERQEMPVETGQNSMVRSGLTTMICYAVKKSALRCSAAAYERIATPARWKKSKPDSQHVVT